MSGRGGEVRFADLTGLQALVSLAEQEALSSARKQTEDRALGLERARNAQHSASTQMEAVFADASLCVDRMRLAASELSKRDRQVADARASLTEAEAAEEDGRIACLDARKRLEWAREGAKAEHRRHLSKREEARLREAIGLLALKGPWP